jgi:tRNA A-37 threonylcarbamoyl transferase component Bud32
MPSQGWKIHVSATLDNCDEILEQVWDYCIPLGLPFKFQRNRAALLLANAKYAHRGSSGKFITLYPRDEAQLERVLGELDAELRGAAGPYILSDLRWAEGPLYVRYGGFAPRYCLGDTGQLVLAITDPEGRLVPDRRDPAFRLPEWISLPGFLEPHLAARSSVRVDEIPYQIERPLHFSNGGGVYLGRDRRTDEQVVLKEARPYAGLDMRGTDAVERLRRERVNLERLAGLANVPRLLDSFVLGDHHFLVEEYVDGTGLRSAIVERNPIVRLDFDDIDTLGYARWAMETYEQIARAIGDIHDRGIVMGDLHAANILVRPDGRITLIDFEAAADIGEGYRPSIADPSFAMPDALGGFDIDDYALACLRLYLFLPMTSLMSIDRGKAADLADAIRDSFDVPASFLQPALDRIGGSTPRSDRRTQRLLREHRPTDWPALRDSMARAILASATPDRDDRLFPGDIAQFDTGGLNIAHGAAGVLYALAMTGAGRFPEHERWLASHAATPNPDETRLGFFDGLHGVAYVLDRLEHRAEARKLLDVCSQELNGRWDRLGIDLYGGLAGIALNLMHMADATDDPSLWSMAVGMADAVADQLGGPDDVPDISGGGRPYAGLMYGSSGPALLFIHLYERTGHEPLLDVAATALRQDLRRCTTRDDGALEVNEGWRTMPYLADGSVGIGMVLDRYLTHRADAEFAAASAAIRRAATAPFYIEPGLFDGRAGMILYLTQCGMHETVAAHIRRLSWHAVSYRDDLAFPGAELMRLSMDLETGTAGVLLAVGAAMHSEPVGIPFLTTERSGGASAGGNLRTAAAGRR